MIGEGFEEMITEHVFIFLGHFEALVDILTILAKDLHLVELHLIRLVYTHAPGVEPIITPVAF